VIKRLFPIIYLICIVIIMHFCVKSFYRMLEGLVPPAIASKPKAKSIETDQDIQMLPLSAYSSIENRNLFQTKTKEMEKKELIEEIKPVVVEEPIKPTELKLKLLGTVSGNKNNACAVIDDLQKRKQGIYRLDDIIQGATIIGIERAKVILKTDRGKEELTMDDTLGDGKNNKNNISKRNFNRDTGGSSGKVSISRKDIQSSLSNVNKLMSQIRIRPHFNRGRPDGLSVNNIKRDSIFSQMGLRNGDIIKGVNNKKIKTVDDVMSLYQQLQSARDIKLEIKRRGRDETIDLNIN